MAALRFRIVPAANLWQYDDWEYAYMNSLRHEPLLIAIALLYMLSLGIALQRDMALLYIGGWHALPDWLLPGHYSVRHAVLHAVLTCGALGPNPLRRLGRVRRLAVCSHGM